MTRPGLTIALLTGLAQFGAIEAWADGALPQACGQRLAEKPITLVVPNAAGGGFDIYARALAPVVERISGVPVRVANMPGGGGKAALLRVADAPPDDAVILVENSGDVVAELREDPSLGHSPEDLHVLGAILVEPDAWIGRPDLDLTAPDLPALVAAVSSVDANLAVVGLVAQATGLTVHFVSGYKSSGEQVAAIMRGEADFSPKSLGTAVQVAKSGDAKPLLVLSDGPVASLPGVPWLVGEGSFLAQRSANLTTEQRAKQDQLARLAVELSSGARMLFVSAQMQAETQDCLTSALDAALVDPAFSDAALAQGRPVTPKSAAEASEIYHDKIRAYTEAAPVLAELANQIQP
jgi:tripartite-type tricarboxylate transporter receptor subunit TctC